MTRLHLLCGVAALLILPLAAQPGRAQTGPAESADGIWERVEPRQQAARQAALEAADGPRSAARPAVFRLYEIDRDQLEEALDRAAADPLEGRVDGRAEISIPLPDGTFARFTIEEAPILAPELAEKHPELRAYRGRGLADPTASVRLDLTPDGFHAQVLSNRGTVRVDPYENGELYASYSKADNGAIDAPFDCRVRAAAPAVDGQAGLEAAATELRTYRLAMAATGEYVERHGGTVAGAMNGIHTTISRVAGIYERELAISFEIVAGNDRLIFDDPANDPFTNDDADRLIEESQQTIDRLIGDADYDIGHTLSTGAGGLAELGAVCRSGRKAQGVTGSENPFGDAFDVDYVAHEIGHQLGADHTFNGARGDCAGSNRVAATAFEPGSGSTIMAYAGICGADNLQHYSDDYFHSVSLEQVETYVTVGGGDCGRREPAGNRRPTVAGGGSHDVPIATPFSLTASGSDPDGDALAWVWEQRDLGSRARIGAPDDGKIPLFRSLLPSADPVRSFPRLCDVLAGASSPGERLPQTPRTMSFRATARDSRPEGGGIGFGDTTVRVHDLGGPFRFTPLADGAHAGLLMVTWEPAGTAGQPIDAEFVDVLLSLDCGQRFPQTLAAGVPNDGEELLLLPNIAAGNARLKIQPVDRIFFAISPSPLVIEPFQSSIVVVRHAEKAAGPDPPLTVAGQRRAADLGRMLAVSPLAAVYSTPTRRTRQTAAPAARAAGVGITEYDDEPALVAELQSLRDGQRILVVGHSNTVPEIVRRIGGPPGLHIPEDEFDHLFVVARTADRVIFRHHRYRGDPP